MPSFVEPIQVDNQDMEPCVAVPSGSGPFPAIVVAQHGGGVDTFVGAMASWPRTLDFFAQHLH